MPAPNCSSTSKVTENNKSSCIFDPGDVCILSLKYLMHLDKELR